MERGQLRLLLPLTTTTRRTQLRQLQVLQLPMAWRGVWGVSRWVE